MLHVHVTYAVTQDLILGESIPGLMHCGCHLEILKSFLNRGHFGLDLENYVTAPDHHITNACFSVPQVFRSVGDFLESQFWIFFIEDYELEVQGTLLHDRTTRGKKKNLGRRIEQTWFAGYWELRIDIFKK